MSQERWSIVEKRVAVEPHTATFPHELCTPESTRACDDLGSQYFDTVQKPRLPSFSEFAQAHTNLKTVGDTSTPTTRRYVSSGLQLSNLLNPVSIRPSFWPTNKGVHQQQYVSHEKPHLRKAQSDSELSHPVTKSAANWDLTKAGKVRKRLPQACIECRIARTKCDAARPKCSNCQRRKRECIFREGGTPRDRKVCKSQASSNTADIKSTSVSGDFRSCAQPFPVAFIETSSSIDSDHLSVLSDLPIVPSRHQLLGAQSSQSTGDSDSPVNPENDWIDNNADIDLAISDPSLVTHYLTTYLDAANGTALDIFSRDQFVQWATHGQIKSEPDRAVLYAALAIGTLRSQHDDCLMHRRKLKALVHQQLRHDGAITTLPAFQAAVLLTFVELFDGDQGLALKLLTSTVKAVASLQLAVETTDQCNALASFDLTLSARAECRRRTFWAAYVADRLLAMLIGNTTLLDKTVMLLHLPCANNVYKSGHPNSLPVFDPEVIVPHSLSSQQQASMGDVSYQIYILTICSEIDSSLLHPQLTLDGKSGAEANNARLKLEQGLRNWRRLYSDSTQNGNGQSLNCRKGSSHERVGFEILYHYGCMQLYRHVFHQMLSDHELSVRASKGLFHALRILELAQHFVEGRNNPLHCSDLIQDLLTSAAVCTAIDVATAAGTTRSLLAYQSRQRQLLYQGLGLLNELCFHQDCTFTMHQMANERCQTIFSAIQTGMMMRKKFYYTTAPMKRNQQADFDLAYGTDRIRYLCALTQTHESIDVTKLLVINTDTTGP